MKLDTIIENTYKGVSKRYPFLSESQKFDIVKLILSEGLFGFGNKVYTVRDRLQAAANKGNSKAARLLQTMPPSELEKPDPSRNASDSSAPNWGFKKMWNAYSTGDFSNLRSESINRKSKRYKNKALAEAMLIESIRAGQNIKAICEKGVKKIDDKLGELKVNPPSRDNTIVRIVKSARSDEEIKGAIDSLIRDKMYFKDVDDKTRISCSDAAWITYSLNRQAGRGIVSSFILAMCVMTRMFFWMLSGRQNKIRKLNTYLRKTAKHPFLFVLGNIVGWIVFALVRHLVSAGMVFGAADAFSAGHSALGSGLLTGAGVLGLWVIPFLLWVRFTLMNIILLFKTVMRENTTSNVVV